jgi:four helix bundle protein
MSVVFPAPFGPINPTTSPGATSRSIPESTSCFPNDFLTARAATAVIDLECIAVCSVAGSWLLVARGVAYNWCSTLCPRAFLPRRLRFSSRTSSFMAKTFEDLRAFQRALDLMVDVYTATEHWPRAEMFGLTSQLRRSSGSVVSNIAEGQGRLTYGEWRQMLSNARGSLYEVQAHVIASQRLNLLDAAAAEHLKKRARTAGRELAGLITWVRRKELESRRKTANNQQPGTSNERERTR